MQNLVHDDQVPIVDTRPDPVLMVDFLRRPEMPRRPEDPGHQLAVGDDAMEVAPPVRARGDPRITVPV